MVELMILNALEGIGLVQTKAAVAAKCPGCQQMGTFDGILQSDAETNYDDRKYVFGLRLCPNPECKAVLYFIWDESGSKLAARYPPERLDFLSTHIPACIARDLEEAVTCNSNQCYTAAAIMVRKTLEELCNDRSIAGDSLKDRLRNLAATVILPHELLDGMDDLRLLGNDAAQIESQEYNSVRPDEAEVGIEFTKEVLKAVFQYSTLLGRLRSLKRTS
jgi:hypothetical protein